jgi:hypothetical protein
VAPVGRKGVEQLLAAAGDASDPPCLRLHRSLTRARAIDRCQGPRRCTVVVGTNMSA